MDEIETLGQYLCQERKKRDISLDQIAYSTRISLKLLRALEEDNHALLPPEPFVRGYLQAYAKYLKIDNKDILLRYQQHIACNPNIYIKSPQPGSIEEHVKEKKKFLSAVVVLLIILCISGVYFFITGNTGDKVLKETKDRLKNTLLTTPTSKETPKEAPEPEKASEPEPEKTPEEVAKAVAEAQEEQSNTSEEKEYNLTLIAKEDVWIRFQTDDDKIKDIILRKSRKITLRADEVVKLFSGNLDGLIAIFNGETLPTLMYKDRKRSVVLPVSEVPNVRLPLFPDADAGEKEEEEDS